MFLKRSPLEAIRQVNVCDIKKKKVLSKGEINISFKYIMIGVINSKVLMTIIHYNKNNYTLLNCLEFMRKLQPT